MTEASFRRVLTREFAEYYEGLRKALAGLTAAERRFLVSNDANHIDFLVWHMARNEDDTVSACARQSSVWQRDEWYRRWSLPEDMDGCGFSVEDVHSFPTIDPAELAAYFGDVRTNTEAFLDGLALAALDDLVWHDNPDVTVGQLLGHLVVEQSQHLGQVAFIRGIQRGLEFSTSWNNPDTPTPP